MIFDDSGNIMAARDQNGCLLKRKYIGRSIVLE
jgi:hypothetical protein